MGACKLGRITIYINYIDLGVNIMIVNFVHYRFIEQNYARDTVVHPKVGSLPLV